MNEKALIDAYNMFVADGYGDTLEDFKVLINSNQDALTDVYNMFVADGYGDNIEDFNVLMGVSNSDSLKKKEESTLPVQEDSLELASELDQTTTDLSDTSQIDNEVESFDKTPLEQNASKLIDGFDSDLPNSKELENDWKAIQKGTKENEIKEYLEKEKVDKVSRDWLNNLDQQEKYPELIKEKDSLLEEVAERPFATDNSDIENRIKEIDDSMKPISYRKLRQGQLDEVVSKINHIIKKTDEFGGNLAYTEYDQLIKEGGVIQEDIDFENEKLKNITSSLEITEEFKSAFSLGLFQPDEEVAQLQERTEELILLRLQNDKKLNSQVLFGGTDKHHISLKDREAIIKNARSTALFTRREEIREEYKELNKEFISIDSTDPSNKKILLELQAKALQLNNENNTLDALYQVDKAKNKLKDVFTKTTDKKEYEESLADNKILDLVSTAAKGFIDIAINIGTSPLVLAASAGDMFTDQSEYSFWDAYGDATLELVNESTLPSSTQESGILSLDNITPYSVLKSIMSGIPFIISLVQGMKKGDVRGVYSKLGKLINSKKATDISKGFKMAERVYKMTLTDNYEAARNLGLEGSDAFIHSQTTTLASALVQMIVPDYKFFDTSAGNLILGIFNKNLKNAVTNKARGKVITEFLKNIGKEIGEEELEGALAELASIGLVEGYQTHIGTLNYHADLALNTMAVTGAFGTVGLRSNLKATKIDIYKEISSNYEGVNDQFDLAISTAKNEKEKAKLIKGKQKAFDINNAILNTSEEVTSKQIDWILEKDDLSRTLNEDNPDNEKVKNKIKELEAKISGESTPSININGEVVDEESFKKLLADDIFIQELIDGKSDLSIDNNLELSKLAEDRINEVDKIIPTATKKQQNSLNKRIINAKKEYTKATDIQSKAKAVISFLNNSMASKGVVSQEDAAWYEQSKADLEAEGYVFDNEIGREINNNEVAEIGKRTPSENVPIGVIVIERVVKAKRLDGEKQTERPIYDVIVGTGTTSVREVLAAKVDSLMYGMTPQNMEETRPQLEAAKRALKEYDDANFTSPIKKQINIDTVNNEQYNQLSPEEKLNYKEQAQDSLQEEAEDQGFTEFDFTEEDITERAAMLLNEDINPVEEISVDDSVSNKEQTDIESFFDSESDNNLGVNSNNSIELNTKEKINRNRLVKIAEMGAKAISKILPDVRIVLHESNEEYLKFVKLGEGRAEYNPDSQIIHINLSNATKSTIPHEIFHAILIDKIKGDPAIAKSVEKMMLSVRKSLKNDSDLAKQIDAFAAQYKGDQEQFQNEERLAELIGILSSAESFKGLGKPTKNIIIQWVKDFAKKYGIKIGSDFGKNDADVIDLLNVIARKTKTGSEIKKSDVSLLESEEYSGESTKNNTSQQKKGKPSSSKSRQQKSDDYKPNDPVIVTRPVQISNAPKGVFVNVGMVEGQTDVEISQETIESRLPKGVKVIKSKIKKKGVGETEDTLLLHLSRPLTKTEMKDFLVSNKQQAIGQMVDGEGILYGNDQVEIDENWGGEFAPQYFPTFNGVVLEEKTNSRQQKDDERENKLEKVMSKIDNIISKSKKRGVKFSKIPDNVVNYLQGTKLYEESTDVQREQMVRDVRNLLGIKEKKAPSVKRILGELKVAKTFTLTDKQIVVKTIKDLNRGAKTAVKSFRIASQILAKEFTEMVKSGNLTIRQSAALLRKFSKVDMLSDASIESFVEYMSRVISDADYLSKISKARTLSSRAKKNITRKIGIADAVSNQLRTIFSIKPTLIPESIFQKYLSLLEMFGENAAVLSPSNINEVNEIAQDILKVMDEEFSIVEELSQRYNSYGPKVMKDGVVDFSATVKNMLNENLIDETEAELMKKYRKSIVPAIEKVAQTEEEIQIEKDIIIKNILESKKVESSSLPSKDENILAKKFKKLVNKKEVLSYLSLTDLKQIEKLIQNLNNGYLPHLSQVMTEKMNAIIDGNDLAEAISKSKIPLFSKMYSKLKNIILLNKRGAVTEAIRRVPLFNIDYVFGDYKTKDIFNSIFGKAAAAVEKYAVDSNKENGKIDKAEQAVFKSFNMDGNKTLISKFKQMIYMIQLEHDSNINNPEVNQAAGFIKKTIEKIDAGETTFSMKDSDMLQEIYNEFKNKETGEIDIDKLYKSFNKAEVTSIKVIQEVNHNLAEKAVFTSAIIRGDRMNVRDNYVHLNVLADTKAEASAAPTTISNFNKSLKPSTKAKSLIKRQGGTSAINFDVYASARKGVKGVLLDYHMTEPIRTARRTLIQAEATLKGDKDRVDTSEREKLTAIKYAFDEVIENLLTNSYTETSLGDAAFKWMQKNGYRAILASGTRWVAELTSNTAFAMITNPVSFISGSKLGMRFLNSEEAMNSMRVLGSVQTTRIYSNDDMSSRMVDSSSISKTEGVKGGRTKGKVSNKLLQAWDLTGDKYQGAVSTIADGLISTPDKIIMRPMWFGKFATEFKKITGINPDFNKISSQDSVYMAKYELALKQSTSVADENSVMTGATANPFMGILKGTSNPNQHVTVKAFNAFNNFMTTFLIYEYTTARIGIVNAVGKGHLTKTKGAQLLAGVATRMVMYTMISQVLGDALGGMAEDEPEEEKSIDKKLGQALASTFSSLLIGRSSGNSTKAILNYGIEEFNKSYLDGFRDGEYDVYKDGIQYQIIPKTKNGQGTSIGDWAVNMSASLGPSVKTIDLILKKATEDPKKTEEAIKRRNDEINIRIPLEILGNAGFIPLYKDVRKLVLRSMYDGMAKKAAEGKRKAQRKLDLLQGYQSESDMKKYSPLLWEDNFGPNSPDYYSNQQLLKEKKNLREEKQRLKDLENGYYPSR